MIEAVKALTAEYDMLPREGAVLCAVSGGADSMCLLHLLSALADFSAESTSLALGGEGNGVYSPISLWFALAMLAETVDGDSRQEILDALGATDLEQLREWADILWHDLYLDNGTASVLLGTSLWLNEGMNFRQETVDALAELLAEGGYDVVYTCGPEVMMAGVARICREAGVACRVSMERMMCCGFGACGTCNVAMLDGTYKSCCKDGPVFDAEEVAW